MSTEYYINAEFGEGDPAYDWIILLLVSFAVPCHLWKFNTFW